MNSKERVATALKHQEPDRVPFAWGFGPNALIRRELDARFEDLFGLDFLKVRALTEDIYRGNWATLKHRTEPNASIWGYTTKGVRNAAGGVYEEFDYQPLASADSTAALDAHEWPRTDWYDYSTVADKIRQADPDGSHYIMGGSANPFEILSWMMGLENSLMWLLVDPGLIRAILRRINDFFVPHIHETFRAADGLIDAWFCADDVGSQNGLLISREAYREVIMPFHREIFEAVQHHGATVFYHSDGSCADLLDDLIEAGIECLDAVQVECARMEPESLKGRFGDRLAFHGAISVQQLLPRASESQVRDEIRNLKATLGAGGGFIAAPSHAIQDGTPPRNVIAMLEAAFEKPIEEIIQRKK